MPVFYKDVMLDCGYRVDVVVEEQVILEIKSVSNIAPIHEAQLLSYLKLSDCKVGLLINFNVKILKDGIRRLKIWPLQRLCELCDLRGKKEITNLGWKNHKTSLAFGQILRFFRYICLINP